MKRPTAACWDLPPSLVSAAIAAALLLLVLAPSARAIDSCPGDCLADGEVEAGELRAVMLGALQGAVPAACPAADSNADGKITIDDFVAAVNAGQGNCSKPCAPIEVKPGEASVTLQGRCDQPTANSGSALRGLGSCRVGTRMRAWRCNDRDTCVADPLARTYLGCSQVEEQGSFSITAPRTAVLNGSVNPEILFEAQVEERSLRPPVQIPYRDLSMLALGRRHGRSLAVGAAVPPAAETIDGFIVDPNSEGALRARTQLGIGLIDDVAGVAEDTRLDVRADYTGTLFPLAATAPSAAAVAFDITADNVCESNQDSLQTLFVSERNIVYQVIMSRCPSDLHVTTLVGSSGPVFLVRQRVDEQTRPNPNLGVGVSCEGTLEASGNIVKSGFLRVGTLADASGELSFEASFRAGQGRVCTSLGDCFSVDQGTPLDTEVPDVPRAVATFAQLPAVQGFNCTSCDTYGFGHLPNDTPTTNIRLFSTKPPDGFSIPSGRAIVFAYRTSARGFGAGFGGAFVGGGTSRTSNVAAAGFNNIRLNTVTPTRTSTSGQTAVASPTPTPTRMTTQPIPTGTETSTATPTASATPGGSQCGSPHAPPTVPAIYIEDLSLQAAGDATIRVRLATAGATVAGAQNDIELINGVTIKARANGRPDCSVSSSINKSGTAFAFLPSGCSGAACTSLRALVLSFDNLDPISDGAVLYTCNATVTTGGVLGMSNVVLSSPLGERIAGSIGQEGTICIGNRTCAPPRSVTGGPTLYVEDLTLDTAGDAEVQVRLATGGFDIGGAQGDVAFGGDIRIKRKTNGKPDCAVNPSIDKNATGFAFRPPGCTDVACNALRALVLATDNVDPIPDGSVLFTCHVSVTGTGGILSVSGVVFSDPTGTRVDGSARDGIVCVNP